MLPHNSNSTATGKENPVRAEGQSLSLDVVQQESTNSATTTGLHYSIWHGFMIPNGGTGHGYDRVFASCLDEKLTSARVEDPYIRSDFQIQNLFRFCKLLDQKCRNLKRITLITKNQGQKYEEKIKQKVEPTLGNRLHFEYKDFHDRKIDFDNGWSVTLGRGLDYFNKLTNPSFGDADDMNCRTCKETAITILRGEANVNADKEFRESRLLGEYTERTEIGHGGFGVIFKAQHRIDKRWYAVKQVDPADAVDAIDVADTEQSPNKVLREVHILAKLDHPHIIRYYDAWLEKPPPGEKLLQMDSNQSCLYIRMEWCSGPTLHEWLGRNRLPEQRPISQTLDWFSQLVSAVKYIHDKKLIHRDIKPGNIFFGSSRNEAASALKIGDFELATYAAAPPSSGVSGDVSATRSIVGTSSYMSPEQPSGHYKNSTDIFSLGLVFLEMLHPFKTDRERYAVFGALRAKQRPKMMNQLDKKMGVLIRWMTAFEPEKRPTASELNNELKKMTAEQLLKSAKEIENGPHAKTNDDTDSNIKSGASTSSLAAIAAVDGAGSSASKCSKPDSSSEARISCSGTSTVLSSGHPDVGGPSVDDGILVRVNFTELLPPEPTLKILWQLLYQKVFEYSLPLLHVGHGRFEFREPHDWPQPRSDESIVVNPWEESFKQLKDGIHVRPGYAPLYFGFSVGGRRLTQCDRLDQALQLAKACDENTEKLIFLHTGLYILEATVTINSDIQIIGASADPDIASRVIIEGQLTTAVTLAKGSQGAYLGWMTVRVALGSGAVAAAIAARNLPERTHHNVLQICDDSTALVEHCVIRSSETIGAAVYVRGHAANPKMRHCVVCDCKGLGICVTNAAQGQFEDCEIARNTQAGIQVDDRANPFFRRCHIHDCRDGGVFTFNHGMGYFESCNIHSNNQRAGIVVTHAANPTVTRCEVHHGWECGVSVGSRGRGQFLENRIHSNVFAGIKIESHSDPKIARNKIWGNLKGGVLIQYYGRGLLEENDIFNHLHSGVEIMMKSNPKITRNKIWGNQKSSVRIYINGQGVLEENEIFDNAMGGISIETDSNPTLRHNKIYDGRDVGVYIYNEGRGVLEDNDIYHNAQAGVLIESESNPTLRRNRIYEGRATGIEIMDGAMATLESNAIFHNRFGGLCLASGVRPILRDNKIYDNDDLVEKTIAKGGCLFEITSRTSSTMHDIYHCDTCNMTEKDAICLNCIRTCHAGHTVRLVRCDGFFCRCGAGMLKHQCKLQSETRDNDSALPVDFELD